MQQVLNEFGPGMELDIDDDPVCKKDYQELNGETVTVSPAPTLTTTFRMGAEQHTITHSNFDEMVQKVEEAFGVPVKIDWWTIFGTHKRHRRGLGDRTMKVVPRTKNE